MMITSGFVRINHARLYFEIQGSGPVVVLVGNDFTSSEMSDQQFDDLSEFYQVIRYDMRGSGKSSAISEFPFSHADDLLELLDHLSLNKVTIAELTLDATIAEEFAESHTERVSAIVPVGSLLRATPGSDPSRR